MHYDKARSAVWRVAVVAMVLYECIPGICGNGLRYVRHLRYLTQPTAEKFLPDPYSALIWKFYPTQTHLRA